MKRLLLVLAAFVLPSATFAQTPSIEYTLSARNPISHLYDVQIGSRGVRSTRLDVAMPAWSPGVYLIRDFAGNVQQLEALTRQNRPLRLEQLDKQTWRISKGSGDDVRLRYRVYSGNLTDEMADVLIKTLVETAQTGQIGDGKIFVSDLTEVIRIRTG